MTTQFHLIQKESNEASIEKCLYYEEVCFVGKIQILSLEFPILEPCQSGLAAILGT